MKILLIEDNAIDIEVVSRWLKGHELVTASSPMEAYSILLKDSEFDACLCDHNLPMANGDTFIKSLQKSCKFPIIVYSGLPKNLTIIPKEKEAIITAIKESQKLKK